MNNSLLLFQAQYLHDSAAYNAVVWSKLILTMVAIPLLVRIRKYKRKVLVHQSLLILMRFHYYYIFSLVVLCGIDFSVTLYSYTSQNPNYYILSCKELFIRRYPQVISAYGTLTTMFMMSVERYAASKNFRTYEYSRKNTIYFWVHILMILATMPLTLAAFDPETSYSVSTGVPAGGQVYHQILAIPLTLIEFTTIFMFERSHRINSAQLRQTGFSLTERYQISENLRILDLMRPIARFHGTIVCFVTIVYFVFGRRLEGKPSYPIFEESINFFQLQGILLPLTFIRHERKERARITTQLESNSSTSGDLATRHATEIMKGW
ncbi:hypothetical protein PRIPAC_82768 [Pristionchus pacificus]|uniref:G protein-coupled receptor n=1 Tax=Pristionchus pacificus TaxID=54126 RepID=A0A2A6CLV3_PRIPA|nr:hypothetical protein PRIPAC_82768 [Pristionchus pacificus]|eukprot:PDM79080.1 G protein-coupled receptor [Pristionchus pacificus]